MEERVKTRAECLRYATMCEQMAADTDRKADRMTLLEAAAQWRTLAKHAVEPRQGIELTHPEKSRKRGERPQGRKSAAPSNVPGGGTGEN